MIRIRKLTDYGIVLLTYFAVGGETSVRTARELAAKAHLPLPTVSKILKSLARSSLLVAHRGIKGGYSLARAPEEITVAEIVAALEGPLALTECSASAPGLCDIGRCVRSARTGGRSTTWSGGHWPSSPLRT